jgi:hypothetical protein
VTVFGILNIIFGAMGVLCTPFSLLFLFVVPQGIHYAPPYKVWLVASSVLGIGFAIWQLVVGIGLLKLKRWARQGAIIYAGIAIGWCLIGTAINLITLATGGMHMPREMLPGFLIGTVAGGVFGLVYPILLLVFMLKSNVRAAFENLPNP